MAIGQLITYRTRLAIRISDSHPMIFNIFVSASQIFSSIHIESSFSWIFSKFLSYVVLVYVLLSIHHFPTMCNSDLWLFLTYGLVLYFPQEDDDFLFLIRHFLRKLLCDFSHGTNRFQQFFHCWCQFPDKAIVTMDSHFFPRNIR